NVGNNGPNLIDPTGELQALAFNPAGAFAMVNWPNAGAALAPLGNPAIAPNHQEHVPQPGDPGDHDFVGPLVQDGGNLVGPPPPPQQVVWPGWGVQGDPIPLNPWNMNWQPIVDPPGANPGGFQWGGGGPGNQLGFGPPLMGFSFAPGGAGGG